MSTDLIHTEEELAVVAGKAAAFGVIALDTEFVWERTYYPRLGIVQAGFPDESSYLIDALEVRDWKPLARVLESPSVVKILHDSPQDLAILQRTTHGHPRNIFDTRIAAGFAGLDSTTSLVSLIEELFHVTLPKNATRTNWLKRPLSEDQLQYAIDDVRYLPPARDRLQEMAAERGAGDWLEEEFASLDNAELYAEPPASAQYSRFRVPASFRRRERAIVRELVTWREEEARHRNRPRRHILPDSAILDLARRSPRTAHACLECRGVSERAMRRYAERWLQMISEVMRMASSDLPETPPPSGGARLKARVDQALAAVKERCAEKGIDPQLVSSRGDLTRLAGGQAPRELRARLLKGWRSELLGDTLIELSEGAS